MAKEATTKTSKSALALALLAGVSLTGIDSASAMMNARTFAAPTVRAKAGGVPMARPNMSHIRPLNLILRQAPRNPGVPIARPDLSRIRPLNPNSRQAAGNPGVPIARPDLSHIRPLNPISQQGPRNVGTSWQRFGDPRPALGNAAIGNGYGGNGAYGNGRAPNGIPSNAAFANGGPPNGLPGPAARDPRNGPHNGIGYGAAAGRASGSDVSTALNPNSTSGGQGREDVGTGSGLQIPAAIAELYRLTNGNLAALSQFGEFADWIRNRPDVVPDPLSPNGGDGAFKWPEGVRRPGASEDDKYGSNSFLNGWLGSGGAPGGPDTSRTGWAANGWHTVYTGQRTLEGGSESYYKNNSSGQTRRDANARMEGGGTSE